MKEVPLNGETEKNDVVTGSTTASRQDDETLRRSEARFRAFVMVSADVVYRLSPDWKQMRYLKGKEFFSDTEHPGSFWIEQYIPDEDRPRVLRAIREAIQNKSIVELQHRVLRLDGTVTWMFSRVVPLLDEQGRIIEWLGTTEDGTERVDAQYRTRPEREAKKQAADWIANQELLQATLDSSMDRIQVLEAVRNEQGDIVDFLYILNNHASQRISGDVIGQSLLQHTPGVVKEGLFETFRRVVETGVPDQSERSDTQDNSQGWFLQTTVKLRDGVATTTADITKLKQAEQEALQLKEELAQRVTDKYLSLFNAIDEGCCIIKVLYDKQGKPHDFRYLDVNPAFEKQAGMKIQAGTTRSAIAPIMDPEFVNKYAEVVRTGEPIHFTYHAPNTGKWHDVYAARIGKPEEHQVTVLFKDVTEDKRAQESLRQSEKRQAFLLRLADSLRTLYDSAAVQAEAARVLGEHLGASRVLYGEVSEDGEHLTIEQSYVSADIPVITGTFYMADFGTALVESLTAGRTIILPDVSLAANLTTAEKEAYAALGIASLVGIPLIKGGRFVANLNIHHAMPRAWTADEVALIQETAERTWAAMERARAESALRASQAQIQKALSTQTVGVLFFRLDGHITDANETFVRMSGYSRQELLELRDWAVLTPPEFMAATSRAAEELATLGETAPYEKQMIRKDGSRWWGLFAPTRLSGEGVASDCMEFIIDITERKQMEQAIRAHQATLQSFYDSAPFLMGIAELDGDRIIAISGNRAAAEFFATDPIALPGKSGTELGNSEDFEQLWIEKYRHSQKKGAPIQFDYEHLRFDGSRWLRATVAFIGNSPAGNPRFSFVVEDITRHKQADLDLRENQRQLQQLTETLEQRVQEKTAEVRQLASDLIKATQRERQRISHVLHDDLQQRIYAIQMQMSFLRDGVANESDGVHQETLQIKRQLDDILQITRDLSIDLSPPILRDEGLSQAIHWLAVRMRRQYGLPIEIQADGPFTISNEELHVLLFNFVRELLFNVVKHAEASQAVVSLKWIGRTVRIEVQDNGKGFVIHPAEEHRAEDNLTLSLGLPTIRHQLSMFDGSMEIHSNPGNGTRIVLTVPVPDQEQQGELPPGA